MQNLDPSWLQPTVPLQYVPSKPSDYIKYWNKCFQKGCCPHIPIYHAETECFSCKLMFDHYGKCILEVHLPTPLPYSITKEEPMDKPEIVPTMEQLNTKALKLINKL